LNQYYKRSLAPFIGQEVSRPLLSVCQTQSSHSATGGVAARGKWHTLLLSPHRDDEKKRETSMNNDQRYDETMEAR